MAEIKHTYTDLPLDGEFTPQGDVVRLFDQEAIENALVYFLTAALPDLFNLSKTGVIRRFINKPLNESTASLLRISITKSIENYFTPKLIIQTLQVIPDYVENEWVIRLKAIVKDSYIVITINERVSAISKGVFNG